MAFLREKLLLVDMGSEWASTSLDDFGFSLDLSNLSLQPETTVRGGR